MVAAPSRQEVILGQDVLMYLPRVPVVLAWLSLACRASAEVVGGFEQGVSSWGRELGS